jgi:hypothetical protein
MRLRIAQQRNESNSSFYALNDKILEPLSEEVPVQLVQVEEVLDERVHRAHVQQVRRRPQQPTRSRKQKFTIYARKVEKLK